VWIDCTTASVALHEAIGPTRLVPRPGEPVTARA